MKELLSSEAFEIEKDVLKKVLPVVVGLSVIIFLILQSNVLELFTIILTADLKFFLIAILFYIIINLIQSLRIKVVLQSQGYEKISALKIFWIHMAGNPYLVILKPEGYYHRMPGGRVILTRG